MSVERLREGGGFTSKTTPETTGREERLSLEELSTLVSSVGNHEAKAITLVLMADGNIYSMSDLYRKFIFAQGKNIGWRMSWSGPFEYCEKSLAPIGLVAKEALNPDLSVFGYQITQRGKELGIPLAGLLLDFSRRYPDVSLIDIFGGTATRSPIQLGLLEEGTEIKKRSPLTRMRILWEITTSPSVLRATDIAESLGENEKDTISKHLQELSAKGIIKYKATELGKPYSFYTIKEDHPAEEPPPYKDRPTPTYKIYEFLKTNPNRQYTTEEIRESIGYKQRERISSILSHLVKQGYLVRGEFSKEKHSEATLSPKQQEMIVDLLKIIDEFSSQKKEVLERGRRLAFEIVNNPPLVSLLLAKAKEHSPQAKKQAPEETAEDLLSLIQQKPGITTKELQKKYQEYSGRRITTIRIRRVLQPLSGKITHPNN